MGIDNTYGTLGLRPGVCTSTTRPSSPFDGQVIYETDTDRIATYDSSVWVYKTGVRPPGLVHITNGTFSAATSFSLPNNTFTSTYENYRLHVTVNTVTSGSTFTLRMRSSGTDFSGTDYRATFSGLDEFGNARSVLTTSSSTAFGVGQSSTAARYSMSLDIMSPQVAQITRINGQFQYLETGNGHHAFLSGAGIVVTTTQYDSLTFISSVSSSISGTYFVYGYTGS